jgi:hypothetical protein
MAMTKGDIKVVADGVRRALEVGAPPHWSVLEQAQKLAEMVLEAMGEDTEAVEAADLLSKSKSKKVKAE